MNFKTLSFFLNSFFVHFFAIIFLGCNYFYSVEEGNNAPDFKIFAFENENYNSKQEVSLSDFSGLPVVINFYYPSCPPCRVEMPDLEYISNEYDGRLEVIGIQQFGLTFLFCPDPDNQIMKKYEIVGFPTTIILDKDHKIFKVWVGYINLDQLIEIIEKVL